MPALGLSNPVVNQKDFASRGFILTSFHCQIVSGSGDVLGVRTDDGIANLIFCL